MTAEVVKAGMEDAVKMGRQVEEVAEVVMPQASPVERLVALVVGEAMEATVPTVLVSDEFPASSSIT